MPDGDIGEKVAGIDRKWWYVIGAGAGVVGYFIYRAWKNRQASASNAAIGAMPSGAGSATTDLSGVTPSVTQTISTLSDWMSQAQTWLTKSLNADPAVVQSALQHYANGHCLTAQEYAYIDKALGQLGMPPDAPYQGLIKCAGAPPPKGKPALPPILSAAELKKFTAVTNNTVLNNLLNQGYQVFHMGGGYFFLPGARLKTGKGHILQWTGGPTQTAELRAAGYTVYTYANRAFYDPSQKVPVRK